MVVSDSKGPLQNFLKGIFVKVGSSRTHFDHCIANLKLKPSLFMPHPNIQCTRADVDAVQCTLT